MAAVNEAVAGHGDSEVPASSVGVFVGLVVVGVVIVRTAGRRHQAFARLARDACGAQKVSEFEAVEDGDVEV